MTTSLSPPSLESHFSPESETKRILALDGGGVRGILTLEFLKAIEKEIGDLAVDLIGGNPLLSYLRYNVEYSHDWLYDNFGFDYKDDILKRLQQMDRTDTIEEIKKIGATASKKFVKDWHFAEGFNI